MSSLIENEAPAPDMDGEEEEHSLLYETFAWMPGLVEFFVNAWKDTPDQHWTKTVAGWFTGKPKQKEPLEQQGADYRTSSTQRPLPVARMEKSFQKEEKIQSPPLDISRKQVYSVSELAQIPYNEQASFNNAQVSSPVVPEVYGLSEQTLASNEAQIQPAPEVPKNTVVAEQTLAQASLDSPSVVAQQSSGVQAPVTAAQSASMLLAENTFQVSRAPITPNQIVGREGPSLPENLYFQTRGRNV